MIVCREEINGYLLYDSSDKSWNLRDEKPLTFDRFIPLKNNLSRIDILSGPIRAYFELTNACNLLCKHCFAVNKNVNVNYLSTEQIIDILDDLQNSGVIVIRFTGGELTLRDDFIEILEESILRGFITNINTNGVYKFASEIINKISRLDIGQITISIDGDMHSHDSIRGTGTFSKAMSSAIAFREKGMRIRSNTSISRNNLHSIEKYISDYHHIFEEMTFFHMRPIGRGLDLISGALTFKEIFDLSLMFSFLRSQYSNINFSGFTTNDLADGFNKQKDSLFNNGYPYKATNINISSNGSFWAHGYLPYLSPKSCFGNFKSTTLFNLWHNSIEFDKFRTWTGKMCQRCYDCGKVGAECSGYFIEQVFAEYLHGIKNLNCNCDIPYIKPWV